MDFSSTKRLSQLQERDVAEHYGGWVSPSSGGAITDEGDVRTDYDLIECKYSGAPGKENPGIRVDAKLLGKIHQEATEVGCRPAVALRLYMPDSPMANSDGFVDWVLRPLYDDLYQYDLFGDYQAEQIIAEEGI